MESSVRIWCESSHLYCKYSVFVFSFLDSISRTIVNPIKGSWNAEMLIMEVR